jgi:hypothetical protein
VEERVRAHFNRLLVNKFRGWGWVGFGWGGVGGQTRAKQGNCPSYIPTFAGAQQSCELQPVDSADKCEHTPETVIKDSSKKILIAKAKEEA